MEKDLRILVSGVLNVQSTEKTINEQLDSLSNKIKSLQLKIELDEKTMSVFNKMSDNIEKITQSLTGQKSAIQDVTRETDKETQAINRQISAAEQLNLLKQKLVKSGGGELKQQITTSGDKFNQTTEFMNVNKDGTIETTRIEEVFDKKKLDEAKKNLDSFVNDVVPRISKVSETIGVGNEEIQKVISGLDNLNIHSSKTDFSNINNQVKSLETSTKKMLDEAYSANEKFNKDAEALDRTHFMALRDNKKRIEDMDKVHHLANLQNNKREEDYLHRKLLLETKIADIRRRFGSDKNVSIALDGLNRQLSSVDAVGNYSKELNKVDLELKKITASANTARSNAISLGEAFKTAMVKFPINIQVGVKLP